MKPPCEVVVGKIIPALRSALVRSLVVKHGMKQTQVARILGITQSAVSQYVTATRAGDAELLKTFPEITQWAEKTAIQISEGKEKASPLMFCTSCKGIRKRKEFCRHHLEWMQLSSCKLCGK